MPGLGLGFGSGRMARNWRRSGSPYHPNSEKLFARMADLGEEPGDEDKARYDALMRVVFPIPRMCRFYFMAAHGPLSSKIEWMIPDDPTRDLIAVGGTDNPEPIFEVYRGRTGGSANGLYDTTLNPLNPDRGAVIGLDNAMMGVWYTQGPGATAGIYSNGNLNMSFVPRHHNGSTLLGSAIIRVNTATPTQMPNDTVPATARHFYLERSAADASDLYVDDVRVTDPSIPQASTGRSNFTMAVCGRKIATTPSWQYDFRQQACAYFGRNLLSWERTAVHEALARYMADVGATPSMLQTAPVIIAHRCSGAVYPEFSSQSYPWAIADGLKHLEIDGNILSDGAIAVMHDSTVDRTTDGTGATSTFDTASFQALNIDYASWFGGDYGTLHPPIGENIIDTYDNQVVFHIEAKSSAAMTAIIAKLNAKKVKRDQYVLYSFSQAVAEMAVAAGYSAGVSATSASDMEAIWSAGIRYVFMASNETDSTIRSYVARGFKVIAYTIERRKDRDRFLALGVRGLYSDDAKYTTGNAPIATSDTWSTQRWMPGMLRWQNRGKLDSGWWGWPDYVGVASVMQGWACPIKGDEAANNFQIDFEARYHAVGATTDWFGVWIADVSMRDQVYTDSGAAGQKGYLILFRQGGRIQIYRRTETASINVFTDGPAFVVDGATSMKCRVRVTPTQIIAEKIDSDGTTVLQACTMNDTMYRGGYISINKVTNARAMLKGMVIS